MSNPYSEDQLIQKSTADMLEHELGWTSIMAWDAEVLGRDGTLGRQNYQEVLLMPRFKAALKALNPWITERQMDEAVQHMTEHMSSQTLMQINEQKYAYIRDGVPVSRLKPNGETETVRARVIDFNDPESDNNEFLCVRELWVHGALYRRRADIVGYVNGIPLLFMELKNHDVEVEDAFNQNYRDYLDTIPQLFYHNAFIMFSNGLEARVGTIDSKWEFFHEWKRLKETDAGSIELPTMLRGVCNKKNFLDLLENFILYDHSDGTTVKIMARNHQYLGVNQAAEMYRNRQYLKGKLGVFWHTQGSGKSYSMLFLAQKIRRKFEGSPTILVLTDRDELNRQISDTFENCGLLGAQKAKQFIAQSGDDLRNKLMGNPSFVFSLIQKFNLPNATPILPDHDIIVMSDEAHRTQNGVFADNMMHMLPTAHRIGFTGTPLLTDDNITARTFGGYVSIYDFKRAVDDHATVPLYYENRGERLQELKNPDINAEIAARLDEEDLDPSQQAKLEREFAQEVHLLTAEKRLRVVAQDIVRHYTDIWTSGKAMVVSFNKVTCVLKAHTLMQTIARANRVAEGKTNGLIVDYIGIVKALRQALADYTANPEGGEDGKDPTINKDELIRHVLEVMAAAENFLHDHGFELQNLIDAENFDKLSLLRQAANQMCETVETRKEYCTYATTLLKLWKFLDREDIADGMKPRKDAIEAIWKELQKKRKHSDITELSVAINEIVNEHLDIDVDKPAENVADSSRRFDISGINFDLLRREFAKSREKNLLLRDIQELLQERIARMLAANPSRIDFYERYQAIIHAYNEEQNRASIEKTFEELMNLSNSLSEEQKRYVREGFKSDEELTMYELLVKENLTKPEIKRLKNVAVELLGKIKNKLQGMDHPFDKPTTKASIVITIRDVLWQELPESYSEDSINFYRDKVYDYVSKRYNSINIGI